MIMTMVVTPRTEHAFCAGHRLKRLTYISSWRCTHRRRCQGKTKTLEKSSLLQDAGHWAIGLSPVSTFNTY